MTVAVVFLGLLAGLVIGAVAGWLAAQRRSAAALARGLEAARVEAARVEAVRRAEHEVGLLDLRDAEREARAHVERDLSAARAEASQMQARLDEALASHREYVETQRRERAEREQREAGQTQVLKTLAPVAQQLRAMQDRVADMEKQRTHQHVELAEQIRHTKASVEESRRAADTLASALSNNAVRGVWGETQLRTLVESAGLLSRVDFETQQSIEAESGARRPDMVVKLPGGKQMAIDAKVPYRAFMDAQRADIDVAQRQRLLGEHAKKVRGHVDALASKSYWTGLPASPEFTVAFIPNDQLLAAAIETDPSLMEHAFKQGIVLATPTNLWGLLKTVAFTWKQDVLTEDAKVLFDLGRELYGRIVKLADHAERLRRSLESSVKNYNAFASSLETRVLVTARKLDQFDEGSILPAPAPIETSPKALTSGDFAALAEVARPEVDYTLAVEQVDAEIVEVTDDDEAV